MAGQYPLFMKPPPDPNQQGGLNFPYQPGALTPPPSIAAPTIPVIEPSPRPPTVDYQGMLDQLFKNPPDFGGQAQQQLDPIYNPQFQVIKNKEGAAKQHASDQDKKIAAMYNALVGDIKGNQKNINTNFDSAMKSTNAAYAQGKQGIAGDYSSAQNSLASMMKSLGIQAAAPNVLSQGSQQQAFLQSLLDATNQGATNLLAANKQSSSDYNGQQGNIARAQGTERRADLQSALTDRLNSLEDQSLGLGSQEAQQKANFIQQLQNAWGQQQQSQANQLFQEMQADNQARIAADDTDYQRVQDAIKGQQSANSNGLTPTQQWQMEGPVQQGYSTATQLLGPDKASQAMNLIMSVGNSKQFNNAFEFAAAVAAANQANARGNAANLLPPDQLQALAAQVYKGIAPQAPSYLQYLQQGG